MAESVSLKIEFDDSSIRTGVDRVRRELDAAGDVREAGQARRETTAGPARTKEERGGDEASKTLRGLVLGQIGGSITQSLAQVFDPLKTDFQKQEVAARAAAEALGAIAGAAAGGLDPDPTTRNAAVLLGAQAGRATAGLAAEGALQTGQVAEDRFVNSRVSQVLQQEASARSAVGGTLGKEEASNIGKQMADTFRLEWQNMMAAMSGTNEATPNLGASIADAVNRALTDTFGGAIGGTGQTVGAAIRGGD